MAFIHYLLDLGVVPKNTRGIIGAVRERSVIQSDIKIVLLNEFFNSDMKRNGLTCTAVDNSVYLILKNDGGNLSYQFRNRHEIILVLTGIERESLVTALGSFKQLGENGMVL